MLTSIRIQNFRSIRDASVKLGQVNLFIGPNNSGKSNFLKGIEFIADGLNNKFDKITAFSKNINKNPIKTLEKNPYNVSENIEVTYIKFDLFFDYKKNFIIRNSIIFPRNNEFNLSHEFYLSKEDSDAWSNMSNYERGVLGWETQRAAKNFLSDTFVYKPEPHSFLENSQLSFEDKPDAKLSNIANFLFNLSQNHFNNFKRLNTDFENCVSTLSRVSTPALKLQDGTIKLKFFDDKEVSYDSEEVSEGVLYFLALLCIIHQPDPPKLLLLEEPEKGIHPRRIREVMDFIFELARLRDIQIILTSHSPYVVDHFANIPECISVFDRENGETVIRNAADLIEQTNKEYTEQGLPPVSYKDSLGEYWLSGFLGGVPA